MISGNPVGQEINNIYHTIPTNQVTECDIRQSCRTRNILSSSRTSVRVKLGLFNAKIRNENRRYIHRLIYQLNEQDLLCHSIWNVSLILVTSLLDGGLKWVNFVIITVETQGQWLCFGCVRRNTLKVTCPNVTCYVLCSRKVSTLWTLQLFCYSPKSGSQV